MKEQYTSATTTSSNSENDDQNILNKLTTNDPSFVHLELSKIHLTQHPNDFVHGLLSSHAYVNSENGDAVKFVADGKNDEQIKVRN
ncbi:hypothetical protein [Rickettsia endosymbiont of Orchestes rusci]|uniref:hypothetical protein n=1 Tax=Rickettsia endosymbiont of Orchestes rusci TaxID=3066250 RepID=UPI00313BC232